MRKLTATLCLTIVALLGSTGVSVALPGCEGSPLTGSSLSVRLWTNCYGTYTFSPSSKFAGDKYVGEFMNGKWHGQGVYTHADGRVREGVWKNNQFQYARKNSLIQMQPGQSFKDLLPSLNLPTHLWKR